MPPQIKLESVSHDGSVEIIQISQGLITLGREPENNVVVDSTTVSRRHASVFSAEDHWLLKDFESSNGTWINGIKIAPGAIKLLRHTDIVTMADFSMRISEVEPRDEAFWRSFPPSLLVFYKEQFDSEYSLAQAGSTFQLGGVDGDYFIEGADPEAVFFKIQSSNDSIEVQVPNVEQKVAVNGTLVSGIVSITDRDELVVPPYRIVVNYPGAAQTASSLSANANISDHTIHAYEHEVSGGGMDEDGWRSESARRKASLGQKYMFGSMPEDGGMERTMSVPTVKPEEFQASGPRPGGYEMSASQKFSAAYSGQPEAKGLGENFLVVFGAIIFILLIVFVLYLVFALL